MFAYHFGWTPETVDDLSIEDFMILTGWLDRHESKSKNEDED